MADLKAESKNRSPVIFVHCVQLPNVIPERLRQEIEYLSLDIQLIFLFGDWLSVE